MARPESGALLSGKGREEGKRGNQKGLEAHKGVVRSYSPGPTLTGAS